jgi:antitoxin Phd
MQVYIYSEARQKLAFLLEKAESIGKVLIRRKIGTTFSLVPEKKMASSPLDVPSIKAGITTRGSIPNFPGDRTRANKVFPIFASIIFPVQAKRL